jgi:hypothetical protein
MSTYKQIINQYYSLLDFRGDMYAYGSEFEFLVIDLATIATIEQIKNLVLVKSQKTFKDKVLLQQIDSAWSNYINTGDVNKLQELKDRFKFSSRMGRGSYGDAEYYETLLDYIVKKEKYMLIKGYALANDYSNLPELINAIFPNEAFGAIYG